MHVFIFADIQMYVYIYVYNYNYIFKYIWINLFSNRLHVHVANDISQLGFHGSFHPDICGTCLSAQAHHDLVGQLIIHAIASLGPGHTRISPAWPESVKEKCAA